VRQPLPPNCLLARCLECRRQSYTESCQHTCSFPITRRKRRGRESKQPMDRPADGQLFQQQRWLLQANKPTYLTTERYTGPTTGEVHRSTHTYYPVSTNTWRETLSLSCSLQPRVHHDTTTQRPQSMDNGQSQFSLVLCGWSFLIVRTQHHRFERLVVLFCVYI